MEVTGEQQTLVSRSVAWNSLFQADVLEQTIPGAKTIERRSDGVFEGEIDRSLASISINMNLTVEIESNDRPQEVVVQLAGVDTRTGSELHGSGTIEIDSTDDGSVLRYNLHLNCTGRLAALGPRLLNRQLNSDLNSFFESFEETIRESPTC